MGYVRTLEGQVADLEKEPDDGLKDRRDKVETVQWLKEMLTDEALSRSTRHSPHLRHAYTHFGYFSFFFYPVLSTPSHMSFLRVPFISTTPCIALELSVLLDSILLSFHDRQYISKCCVFSFHVASLLLCTVVLALRLAHDQRWIPS
ncbi:uncharacterized protein EI90DRAFT_3056114 [Cantharellus anzutake]|uniref:uncharacterized protein n=1 Tax=Cantharellus anzutake TaxID=1750568 RepID=UPI001902FCA1|nr:uncharacterized protein EI90DRAFT_3056114 [Cantharellus anzutake]KAF8331975.1 hypothetical protein EI90DRAFT_3056114 [Cantharellus anzutake]